MSVLVVAQPISVVPEGLMNYPVYIYIYMLIFPWKIMAFKHKVRAPSKLKGADLLNCFNGGSREGDKDKNGLDE